MQTIVVISNRLPVDRVTAADGTETWQTSPGGLVTAMEPVVRKLNCVWIGWPGSVDEPLEPFEAEGIQLHPVTLDQTDFELYYEGFANDTIWPLYHDVISRPGYHREWWDRYTRVNRRFAEAAAQIAEPNATVWVHDYQLQLVPKMLRELRPDVTIAFFMHIPFPALGLFGQLPWRREVLEGLLGADVIGFQRVADAANFRAAVRRLVGAPSNGNHILLPAVEDHPAREVLAQEFPISIDTAFFENLARSEKVQQRAKQIRAELGNPKQIILGVDRLDYTKGIRHRLKAFAELLEAGQIQPGDVTMVQVASPSRERVEAYRTLRDNIEVKVSRINGDYGTMAHQPVVYLHRGYPREEMAALYVAADVLAVTSLRDGMNLVAKEYVACRSDERGVLVLSEFAGAADELRRAIHINPHDINGMKAAFLEALAMEPREQGQRMRAMRRVIQRADVDRWAGSFIAAVEEAREATKKRLAAAPKQRIDADLDAALKQLAKQPEIIVASDFDGTLSKIVDQPEQARVLPRAEAALLALQELPGTTIALVSGRAIESLRATGVNLTGRAVSGSHGAELMLQGEADSHPTKLSETEQRTLAQLRDELGELVEAVAGARLEAKPFGFAVHVRQAAQPEAGERLLRAVEDIAQREGLHGRAGKMVQEVSVRSHTKGDALRELRAHVEGAAAIYLGDDVTDEDAFAVLGDGDVAVKVGAASDTTRAGFVVPDVETVADVLERLAELRAKSLRF